MRKNKFNENKDQKESKGTKLKHSRRDFMKKIGLGLGGLSLAGMTEAPIEDQLAYATKNVSRNSNPSALKITDLRIANVWVRDGTYNPIVRIYTNQGIIGHGDVRPQGDPQYALMLKSRILGKNPCNVEQLFRIIQQFGDHGRQGGGVSGVEIALWDIAGKAYGVPIYQLLGGKYRDKIRMYCDTTKSQDPQVYAQRMQKRIDMGYTALKMDLGISLIKDIPDTLTNYDFWKNKNNQDLVSYRRTKHPLTHIQVTKKGIEELMKYLETMRSQIGYEIPLGTDHWGHFGINDATKLARAAEPYTLSHMEDLFPWQYTDQYRTLKESTTTPILTGEDIYLLKGFKPLIDNHAVDIVHPDLLTAGGILETKKIGDYAEKQGIAMQLHLGGSPISYFASVHSAAATRNFLWLEHHNIDSPWWEDLVTGIEKPIVQDGYIPVPEAPGLGVELNEKAVKKHLVDGAEFFAPTPEWNESPANDRLWS